MTMEASGRMLEKASSREVDRLLARLAGAREWCVAEAEGAEDAGDAAARALTLSATTRPHRLTLSPALLEEVAGLGLVERRGNRLSLAAPGISRLRRVRSGGGEEAFRRQHQLRGTRQFPRDGGGAHVAEVNDAESPLAWLRRRRGRGGTPLLDEAQFAAGERLRADHERAGIGPVLASPAWNVLASGAGGKQGRGGAGGMSDLHDSTLDARDRIERARLSVGPELFPVLIDVCCDLKGLEEVERARNWPARSAKLILSLALTRLARHYGYAERSA